MSESTLSFDASASFRNSLLGRNLPPYSVEGAYIPPAGDITYEVSPLNDSSVIDSPNELIGTTNQANELYPLNQWGPDGGFSNIISTDGAPLPVNANQGEYGQDDADIDLVNEFFIDAAYIKNTYGPEGGYKDLLIITDNTSSYQYYLPYYELSPSVFVPSQYSPFEILTSDNPTGSNGPLSSDSFMVQFAAKELKRLFTERIDTEIYQATAGIINLDALQDPFEASLVATGQQPLINKNWKITVPQNPLLAAVSFGNRLTGTYFPVSFIPGEYFTVPEDSLQQTKGALNILDKLTGGFLGSILNRDKNPSKLFLENTGYGQKSVLFKSLEYNRYRPEYERGIVLGVIDFISDLLSGGDSGGGYYVGSKNAEPSTINSPPNEIPVDAYGKQQPAPVYGPAELAQLYEGNIDKIQFGLKGKSYSDKGGITGQFTWTSPKYKDNLGYKVKPGGDVARVDGEFNSVKAEFNGDTQSDEFEFKTGSILDNTQRLIVSADGTTGAKRLKHVGNAINQISKVFNDGYKELTKGSQVIAYYDSVTNENTISIDGTEVGMEYCRVFQKDTPYYTYNDLQKVDGITTEGRKFHNSVFDNTFNLNIAPLRNPGSTNIVDGKVKKYMFSLENLAWRTSSQPGFTYDELPVCERGPNGGRIMWFPPYALTFSESSTANWNSTQFLGRPEAIHTYKHTNRTGTISWTIVVDSPASMNTIIEKQLAKLSEQQVDSIMNSFFAGCVKYDLYDLAAKFNTIPISQLYTYQELLSNPRLTDEEKYAILNEIPSTPSSSEGGSDTGEFGGGSNQMDNTSTSSQNANSSTVSDSSTSLNESSLDEFIGTAFYFDNDFPTGSANYNLTVTEDYQHWYNLYVNRRSTYQDRAPAEVDSNGIIYTKEAVLPFFDNIVQGNFTKIQNEFLPKLGQLLKDAKATVSVTLEGSASAPAEIGYNEKLSYRRTDTVEKWLDKQTVGDKKISEWKKSGQLKFEFSRQGEQFIIPNGGGQTEVGVDCRVDIKDTSLNKVTSYAQWYSVPAMVCRRVGVKAVKITNIVPPTTTTTTTRQPDPVVDVGQERYNCVNGECVKSADGIYTGYTECLENCSGATITIPNPPKKVPPDINKKIKEGISKKVLRHLFSECDYFEVIKETDPMVYASLKDKVKYFSPTFHSTTPEGLNARLTFLNQCVRPGQTIPVIGPDGKPKYNDAKNTSFGSPPVLVLRIGDFYHTKIIPNQLSIQFEPLLYDINPEGIGVQPMLAKVSLGFEFIGGHGLAHPIATLQNALSFNYYANTEIYDERSESTESTKDKDEALVAKIISRQGSQTQPIDATTNSVTTEQTQKGGSTIGNILSTNLFDNGSYEEGEIEYKAIFKELSDKTNNYFKTIFNQLKSMNEVSNYGLVQLVSKERNYTTGDLAQYSNDDFKGALIYGKPSLVEQRVEKVIRAAVNDVQDETNPIIKKVVDNPLNFPNSAIRELKTTLQNIVKSKEAEINQATIVAQNEMTKYQEDYIQTFKKLDVVSFKIDGYKLDTGEYKVYNLIDSGSTATDIFGKMKENYQALIGKELNSYNELLISKQILNTAVLDGNDNYFVINENDFTQTSRRFYFVMSDVFTNNAKFLPFVESLITEKVKLNTFMEKDIRDVCEQLRVAYEKEFEAEKKRFSDFEASPEYQKFANFKIDEFETKLNYSTQKDGSNFQKKKILKETYSDNNLNNNRKSFNDKVTFN